MALVVTLISLVTAGCGGSSSSAADQTFGALPSFLPSDAVQADSELVGNAKNPAVTSQGDSVKAELGTGSVSVVVGGPEVPGEGLPNPPAGTTATWQVTFHGATAPVPIDVADFVAVDHLGKVYHPALVAGQPKPPPTVLPGKTVKFELRAYMAIGEGLMHWSPGGKATVASWDFVVEND
jgi:hypothetical protein